MAKINSEIGRTAIDEKVRMKLWAVSAGRCEICNKLLYTDGALGYDGNFGELAHIHAVSQGGPRHKYGMTNEDKNNIDNLMLLCPTHHHLIDSKPEEFGDGLLVHQKKLHEDRIRKVTDITENESTKIITFFSNIDNQQLFSSERLLKEAVLGVGRYPKDDCVIELCSGLNTKYEPSKALMQQKATDLESDFSLRFNSIIKGRDSISVFSLAPQPLLFKLGTLINDQYNALAFQCHRSGHKWAWKDTGDTVNYQIKETKTGTNNKVALVIDLSAAIMDDRITSVLGDDVTIIHLTIDNPNREFVKTQEVQNDFVRCFREAMEMIKNLRPAPETIHLFPAMPNSLAVRAGMDYMPKADLPLLLYEQANAHEGFFDTIQIGG